MDGRFLHCSWLLVAALLACFAVPPTHAQIFETICWDANCTYVALGPLSLAPQCYQTPQSSVGLSINESDVDVLNLCFYASDSCNESADQSCYTFYNGEPQVCPFLRALNGSLYVVFAWDPAAIDLLPDYPDPERSRRQLDDLFGLTNFGNWCGPGHGGTSDCCNDKACSRCNDTIGTPTTPLDSWLLIAAHYLAGFAYAGLDSACLDQCPAKDGLDLACATHDFCYGSHNYTVLYPHDHFTCTDLLGIEQSGYCQCDCNLVKSAREVNNTDELYKSALIFTFTHLTNCWYNSTSGPECNKDDRILVTEFC